MRVGKYATQDVPTIDGRATVSRGAELMRARHVGDLIVVKGQENRLVPVGIVTDRDIVVGVIGQGLDPRATCVNQVMSKPLLMVNTEDQLTDALRAMSDQGVRRAPVVDDHGVLKDILALDDLISVLAAELARVTRLIRIGLEREQARTNDACRNEFST